MSTPPPRRVSTRRKPAPRGAAAKSTNIKNGSLPASAAAAARGCDSVVLVLQGGGALGAYQCGVRERLDAAGTLPDGFAGISMAEPWAAGRAEMRRTLARPQGVARPAPEAGVPTHAIHRQAL